MKSPIRSAELPAVAPAPAARPSPPSYPPPPPGASPEELQDYERGRWNHFLLDETWRRTRFNPQPNALLVEAVRNLPPGKALDVSMGEGRNALYLALQGWQVTGVDYADKALAFAQRRAQELGVALTTVEYDVNTYDWGLNQWDLVVLCYADEDAHVAQVQAALKPGGLLVLENFHTDVNQAWQSRLGKAVGFATNELKNIYAAAGFDILRYEEPLGVADFSQETQRLVKLIARKQ